LDGNSGTARHLLTIHSLAAGIAVTLGPNR
jgi:hypothetical protein